MPNRYLRDSILASEPINSLDDQSELFYRRLMSVVDDFGRFDARASILRTACYPLKIDRVREADISRWKAACLKAGVVRFFEAGGKEFGVMLKTEPPRAKLPKWPQPPAGIRCWRVKSAGKVDECEHLQTYENTCKHMSAYALGTVPDTGTDNDPGLREPDGLCSGMQKGGFPEAWKDWLAYREESHGRLTGMSKAAALSQCERWLPRKASAIIRLAILKGWKNLIDPDDPSELEPFLGGSESPGPEIPDDTEVKELLGRIHDGRCATIHARRYAEMPEGSKAAWQAGATDGQKKALATAMEGL